MNANLANCNGNSGGNWTNWSGSNNSTWASGVPPAGQTAAYYLRYVLDQLGPDRAAAGSSKRSNPAGHPRRPAPGARFDRRSMPAR
jgi:hypothetical protein